MGLSVVYETIKCASCKKEEANNYLYVNNLALGVCDPCVDRFKQFGVLTVKYGKSKSKEKPTVAMQKRRKHLKGRLKKLNERMEHRVQSIKQKPQNVTVFN